VIGDPLSSAADQETFADPSARAAARFATAAGGPAGVTAFEIGEGADGPASFTAVTVNVYSVPFDRPGTTTLVASGLAEAVLPPGDAVTTYVDAAGPLPSGGDHDTVTDRSPRTAVTPVTAFGAPTTGL
jgi:hypothetical protein